MLKIYKKVEKNKECPMGYIEIDPQTIDKPFLMCVSAQDNLDSSIYGTIREGACLARLYTTQEVGASFRTNDFPADFLGFRFVKDEQYKNNYEELVNRFLYSFLVGNGSRSIEEIKKRARMVNFMTYCDGTETYKNIESFLEKKLLENGYLQVDIDNILSRLAIVSIGTMQDTSKIKATSACFIDVNDKQISNSRTSYYTNVLKQNQQDSIFGALGSSQSILYIYNGSGNHSLKEYSADGVKVKPALCSVISYLLSNSINNANSDEFVPISNSDIRSILSIYGIDSVKSNELLAKLDSNIDYKNATKYTPEELVLREELDMLYKEHLKTKYRAERKEVETKVVKNKLDKLQKTIGKYSSDATLLQILVEAGLYQAPIGVDPFAVKSDKEIRKEFEKTGDFSFK